MLRWFILIVVLIGDLLLLTASIVVLKYFPIFLVFMTYKTWQLIGGLSNWKFSTMKSFLKMPSNMGCNFDVTRCC